MNTNGQKKSQFGGPGFQAKPGQKTNNRPHDAPGGRKASNEEMERRVEFVAKLLVPGMKTKTQIHAAMAKRYKLRYGTVDVIYIPRAEKWLAQRSSITASQAKKTSVNTLFHIIGDGTNGEKLKALSLLADIYGYNAPHRHELTGAGGGPVATKDETPLPTLTRERLVQLVAMADDRNGSDGE